MATQEDLAKLGMEAFAMLDKYYGRPIAGGGIRTPFPYSHEDHHQPRAHPHHILAGRPRPQQAGVINSKDAALAFGGFEIKEYDQKRFRC
ncbi:hypothetical protein RchiOBHm_Chr4g0423471 [Rosa chinensis]|uniref:Uncharacterized protein n=1 Tax=Rosa chinensis TaxID=74649 RepID=A0A2P6QYL1_ROSCH|nr:hypothetical protein RchiOBHm_Chr4g0423471 [Rosa chinensis]